MTVALLDPATMKSADWPAGGEALRGAILLGLRRLRRLDRLLHGHRLLHRLLLGTATAGNDGERHGKTRDHPWMPEHASFVRSAHS